MPVNKNCIWSRTLKCITCVLLWEKKLWLWPSRHVITRDTLIIHSELFYMFMTCGIICDFCDIMIMSSHGSPFCIAGPLFGESTNHLWIPFTQDQWCRILMFCLMSTWWQDNGLAPNRLKAIPVFCSMSSILFRPNYVFLTRWGLVTYKVYLMIWQWGSRISYLFSTLRSCGT